MELEYRLLCTLRLSFMIAVTAERDFGYLHTGLFSSIEQTKPANRDEITSVGNVGGQLSHLPGPARPIGHSGDGLAELLSSLHGLGGCPSTGKRAADPSSSRS